MHVEFRLFGPYREEVGERSLGRDLPAEATVGDALEALTTEFEGLEGDLPVEGPSTGQYIVTVNKRNVRQLDGAETRLSDGDVVRISPAVAGGRRACG